MDWADKYEAQREAAAVGPDSDETEEFTQSIQREVEKCQFTHGEKNRSTR